MELERVFRRWIYFHLYVQRYFSGPLIGGDPPRRPLWIRHRMMVCVHGSE